MLNKIIILGTLLLSSFNLLAAEKPNLWIYSDLSDPRDLREHGHPQNDPDDISALGALLLTADRFNIQGFVYSSTNRKNLTDATPFIAESFIQAYKLSVPVWRSKGLDYQIEIPFIRSDITKTVEPSKYQPSRNYADISQFNSIIQLVELLNKKPIYVLNWGPLTESAILLKHLLDTNNQVALNNLTIISHWTKSATAQGTIEKPFHVANCRDDFKACMFLHEEALANPIVKFIEIGPAGQSGIVNGSVKFNNYPIFENSPLGQIFYHAKFFHRKPDQSDAATFWLLTELGANLDDYQDDGSLTFENEKTVVKKFYQDGKAIIEELAVKSEAAKQAKSFSKRQISDWFSYLYIKKDKIELHLPYDGQFKLMTQQGRPLIAADLNYGDHYFEFKHYPYSDFIAELKVEGITKRLSIGPVDIIKYR